MLFLLILALASGSIVSLVWFSYALGITPMPSSPRSIKTFLGSLPQKPSLIYELGSGWGAILFAVARASPQHQIKGFELSWIPWLFSLLRKKLGAYSNVSIYRKDFFKADISEAEGIICYLYPRAMQKLGAKFERELLPETWIISNTFALPQWRPEKIVSLNDLWNTKIYIYTVGIAASNSNAH